MKILKDWIAIAIIALTLCDCKLSKYAKSSGIDKDYISRGEIESCLGAANAYCIIEKLRPHWLNKYRMTSQGSLISPYVYVDNQFFGGITSLRYIETSAIASIQYLNELDAFFQFGGYRSCPAGVISVKTGP